MDVATPPASGPRMQEVGDRLVVSFRPRRSGLVFLSIWLVGWTVGGFEAWSATPKADPSGAAFLLFWLCGWFLGEFAVICIIAWMLLGRVSLAVTSDELELSQKLAGFKWVRRYEAALVEDVTIGRMPAGEDGLHKDYSLRLAYDGRTGWVGAGMGEREADYVASAVLSRIRKTSWWNDDHETLRRASLVAIGRTQIVAPSHTKAVLLVGAVIATGTLLGVPILRLSQHHHRSVQRTRPSTYAFPADAFPARGAFANPRDYAESVTSWAVNSGRSGRSALVSQLHCDAHATWTHWSCTALVSSDRPTETAGLAVPYRCRSESSGGVTCELAVLVPPQSDGP
jgi:hypothetical protein